MVSISATVSLKILILCETRPWETGQTKITVSRQPQSHVRFFNKLHQFESEIL